MYTLKQYFDYSPIGALWNQKKSIFWLLKNKGIKEAWNYIKVKLFVREGEGTKGSFTIMLAPLYKRFPKLAPYPYNVEIEITHRCNKKCIICEHTYWKEDNNWDLSLDDFKKIVNNFPKLTWVNLTGEGDAFLNKDYLKMIEYLKNKNIPVYLVESFDLINENIAKKLVKLCVNGIYISFDGATKETYEKIKVGCNFDRTLNNIKKLLELKKKYNSPFPHIYFRFIVNKLNYQEMPEFVKLVRSLGTREELGEEMDIVFGGLLPFKEIEKYKMMFEDIPKEIIAKTLANSKKLGIPVKLEHNQTNERNINGCLAWFEPYFMRDGYVMPCCAVMMSNRRNFLRKHSLGNINKTPFKKIWKNKKYLAFKEAINNPHAKVPSICLACRSWNFKERVKKYGVLDISKIK